MFDRFAERTKAGAQNTIYYNKKVREALPLIETSCSAQAKASLESLSEKTQINWQWYRSWHKACRRYARRVASQWIGWLTLSRPYGTFNRCEAEKELWHSSKLLSLRNETKNFGFCFAFRSLIRKFDVRRTYYRSFSTSFRKRLLRRRARKNSNTFGFSLTYS